MRWDLRHPEKHFGDRIMLVGGHTIPLVYCTLAVLNEVLRTKYGQTQDPHYLVPGGSERAVYPEDLVTLRWHGGSPGMPRWRARPSL
jgi:transketolase